MASRSEKFVSLEVKLGPYSKRELGRCHKARDFDMLKKLQCICAVRIFEYCIRISWSANRIILSDRAGYDFSEFNCESGRTRTVMELVPYRCCINGSR